MGRRVLMLAAIVMCLALLLVPAWAGDVYVRGYTKSDGTYVAPHFRSAPDSSYNNNWSTSPNVNPYTGEQGRRTPRLDDSNGSTLRANDW